MPIIITRNHCLKCLHSQQHKIGRDYKTEGTSGTSDGIKE